jgi:hypothetical protein
MKLKLDAEAARELISQHMAQVGRKGGKKRAQVLTKEQRSRIAKQGAKARWKKGGKQ